MCHLNHQVMWKIKNLWRKNVELHITSREEVADLLGLSHITSSIGAAKEVTELTVKEVVVQFRLPPNHITELQAAFEDTLAAIP